MKLTFTTALSFEGQDYCKNVSVITKDFNALLLHNIILEREHMNCYFYCLFSYFSVKLHSLFKHQPPVAVPTKTNHPSGGPIALSLDSSPHSYHTVLESSVQVPVPLTGPWSAYSMISKL